MPGGGEANDAIGHLNPRDTDGPSKCGPRVFPRNRYFVSGPSGPPKSSASLTPMP